LTLWSRTTTTTCSSASLSLSTSTSDSLLPPMLRVRLGHGLVARVGKVLTAARVFAGDLLNGEMGELKTEEAEVE